MNHCFALRIVLAVLFATMFSAPSWAATDLSKAVIVPTPSQGVILKAATMLQEELAKRSGITIPINDKAPDAGVTILLGTVDSVKGVDVPAKPESYAITVDGNIVKLVGRDARGVMFAAGRLIRLADYSRGKLAFDLPKPIATAPDVPYRAHQLGYRNTANTYDAWSLATFEQHLRDLIMFGCNGIELIPGLRPNMKDGPVMTENFHDMNVKLSGLIASYGMDVWFYTTVMEEPGEDVTNPEGQKKALEIRRSLFSDYPAIDHIFIAGGDGGDTPAQFLMPFIKVLAPVLREKHPNVKFWVSNQTFTIDENNYFFDYLAKENPDWLTGVVYGPWTKMGMEEFRDRTPKRYLFRNYPDITHTTRCQFPVENWDPAFANTEGREPIMPRPQAHKTIYLRYKSLTDGFGTYSDGVNDDFNKDLWSIYGWEPNTDLNTLLYEYGKLWWGTALAREVAQGLTMLEEDWQGPILQNTTIPKTLALWESISKRCPDFATNWRAQMYLFRARYDAYVQEKARAESKFEAEALAALAKAPEEGSEKAINDARKALAKADAPIAPKLRKGIEKLGPVLLKSIGYQLSVKEPYKAANPERGAMLDWLDQPVNDRPWLEERFDAILAMKDTAAQLAAIGEIINWTDPGPGGFYDDLGTVGQFKHVVYQQTWEQDPQACFSPRVDYPLYKADKDAIAKERGPVEEANATFKGEKGKSASTPSGRQELRMSWQSVITSQYGTPLKMHYEGLDPAATYRLKVTYAGRYKPSMTLTLNETYNIHDPLKQPSPIWPIEYYIPREVTKGGTLDIEWNLVEGRGCQVAEVWLIKK